MKRKEWIVYATIIGLMSCSETKISENLVKSPLKFSGHVQKTTKGQAFTGNRLTQPFIISTFAIPVGESLDLERIEYVMSQQLVSTADGGNTFQYSPLMFFPLGKELMCCAYSPASLSNVSFSPIPGQTDSPMLYVEIPLDVSEQKDIMLAYKRGITALNSINGISMNFIHALSQITFAAKTTQSNLKIVIKKIELESINDRGTFCYSTIIEANDQVGEETYVQTFNGVLSEVYYDNPGYKTLTTSSNAMLLMPQDLTGRKLSVTYDAYMNLPGDGTYSTKIAENERKSVNLSGKWESGMAYRYELSIQPGTSLNFETSVNTWVEKTNSSGI